MQIRVDARSPRPGTQRSWAGLEAVLEDVRAAVGRLQVHAGALLAGSWPSWSAEPAAAARRGDRRGHRVPPLARRQQLHLPRLPRIQLRGRGGGGGGAGAAGHRLRPAAQRGLCRSSTACATWARLPEDVRDFLRRAGAAADHQVQPPLDRAPVGAHGRHRRSRRSTRRGASPASGCSSACSPPRPTRAARCSIPLLAAEGRERRSRAAASPPTATTARALRHILETYPRDELFQISARTTCSASRWASCQLQERQRVALFVRRDPFERFVSCLVFVPRDRYDTDLRHRVRGDPGRGLPAASVTAVQTRSDRSALARLHIHRRPPRPGRDRRRGRRGRGAAAGRGGALLGRPAAARRWSPSTARRRGSASARRYANAFPAALPGDASGRSRAVFDIECLERRSPPAAWPSNLYRRAEARDRSEVAPQDLRPRRGRAPLRHPAHAGEHGASRCWRRCPTTIRPAGVERRVWHPRLPA